jgi:TctA family transporter
MPKTLFTSIGWIGVVLCTLAYVLLSTKVIRAESLVFQVLNIVGGLCLCVPALETSDMPNTTANLLWMFTGIFGLGRHFWSKRAGRR